MERNEEIWKDIEGYEGLYQVSNLGRVKSLERYVTTKNGKLFPIRERILRPATNPDGYLQVALTKETKDKTFRLHRLVAEAFIPNADNLPQVNHKNEVKDDNRVENLEWCTNLYNHRYGTCIQRMAETLSKRIYQISLDGSEIFNIWKSAHEVERYLGWRATHIAACARGKRKSAYNYKWIYAEDLLKPFRQENKEENTTQ